MYKTLNLDGCLIQNTDDFESWLMNRCDFDKFDCTTISEMYDETLQASQYKEWYKDMERDKNWYQDYVWSIRNEIMNIVEDMQERLTGRESRQQLACIYDLLEEL